MRRGARPALGNDQRLRGAVCCIVGLDSSPRVREPQQFLFGGEALGHGQEQFGAPVLSVELLEGIIRFYGNPVQEMLSRYLEQSLGTLLRQQQGVQTEMTKALESPLTPLAELTRQNMELWARMQASMLSAFAPPRPSRPAEPPAPEASETPTDEPPVPPAKS